MTTASHATAPTPASAPLIQRLAAGDIFWVDQKNAEAQAILKFGHAYIAATLPMRPTMSPVMITLILTEEGRAASEKQREFFGDLDNAEKSRDAQAASKATHNPDTIKLKLGTQEVTGYSDEFLNVPAMTIKPGDKVRIVRKVTTDSEGRDCEWTRVMDDIIGRTGRVVHLYDDGMVAVSMDAGVGFDFSREALELIAE